jgi:hypothetical protein
MCERQALTTPIYPSATGHHEHLRYGPPLNMLREGVADRYVSGQPRTPHRLDIA